MLSHYAMFHNQSDVGHNLVPLAARLKQHHHRVGEPIVTYRFISLRQQPTRSVLQRERCQRRQEPQAQAGSTMLSLSVGLLEAAWECLFLQLRYSPAGDITIAGLAETLTALRSVTYPTMPPMRCMAR